MRRVTSLVLATVVVTTSFSATATGPPSTAEMDSKRSEFHWHVPAGWEFAEPDRTAQSLPTDTAAEVVGARAKGQDGPLVTLIVTESVSLEAEDSRKPSDASEQYGRMKLGLAGASSIKAERVSISGIPTTRVSAIVPRLASPFRSVTVLKMGRRRFEIVCSAHTPPNSKEDPCDPALAGLTLRQRDDALVENPRPLRLRGEVFGIHYDPPDERWLGIGPRLGMGGAQNFWAWMLDGKQIDVQGLDVSVFAAYPDARGLANQYATRIRGEGGTARIGTERHGGLVWTHLEVSRGAGGKQEDMFIHRVEDMVYTVHVSHTTRDRSLIRRALAGFTLAKPSPADLVPAAKD